jgi:hypothetical protein
MATAISTYVNVLGAFRTVRDAGNVHSDCVPVAKEPIQLCRTETGRVVTDKTND